MQYHFLTLVLAGLLPSVALGQSGTVSYSTSATRKACHPKNSTSIYKTGAGCLSGTGASSGFSSPGQVTAIGSNTNTASGSGRLPYKSTTGIFYGNSTALDTATASSTNVWPTRPIPTGIVPTGSIIPTGRVPFTKSSGLVFTNSTSTSLPTSSAAGYASSSSAPATSSLPTSEESSSVELAPPTIATSSADLSSSSTIDPVAITSTFSHVAVPTLITRTSPGTISISGTIPGTIPGTISPSASAYPKGVVAEYYQCGGINYKGSKSCAAGMVCKNWNPYYSQCVDERYV